MRARVHLAAVLSLPASLALVACGGDDGDGHRVPGLDAGVVDGRPGDGGLDGAAIDAAPVDAPPPIDAAIDAPPLPQSLAVCATGGAPYATIGAAIAAAAPGDDIRICPGTYHELLVVDKPLMITGDGDGPVIIDGGDAGTPLTVRNVGAPGLHLQFVTLTHGRSSLEGGGVRCEASTFYVADSIVDANVGAGGGGLYASECGLFAERLRVTGNRGGDRGGGVLLVGSHGYLRHSVLVDNQAIEGGGLHQADLVRGDGTVVPSTVELVDSELRANTAHRGGGLYQDAGAAILRSQIADNVADWTGGGAFVVGHAPMIAMNTISGNHSANDGGGIYLHQSNATLDGNEVRENVSGDDGGGIRVFESQATLTANLVVGNRAGDGGGGIRVSHVPSTLVDNIVRGNDAGGTGGGMDLDNDASTVRGGIIEGNHAGGSGGGIFAWLGPWNGHRLEGITITGNRAWQGGGLYVVDNFQPVTMRGLRVTGNRAAKGGGLMIASTAFTLAGSLFADNVATDRGGAIFAGASAAWPGFDGVPGTCPCPPEHPTGQIDFTVLARNQAPHGAGVWTAFPSLAIAGTIVHGHDGAALEASAEGAESAPAPAITYSDIHPAAFAGMTDPTGQDGNLDVDPMFVDEAAGDYHLQPGSACIDAAAPNLVDADGTRADMGMFGGAP